jgi:hypothetical protein
MLHSLWVAGNLLMNEYDTVNLGRKYPWCGIRYRGGIVTCWNNVLELSGPQPKAGSLAATTGKLRGNGGLHKQI